ncbi:TPA: hypothetical protein ACOSBN_004417, partial [Salmonella enterica]
MVSFIKVSLWDIPGGDAAHLSGLQSGSPDRRNAPPPGKEQIYIASTYFSITPAAIAEPITPAT